jgi:hypothetical protein
LFTFKELFQKKRMLTNHVVVAICLLIVLSSQKATVTTTFWCTIVFWTYILIDFRRKHFRPHNPDTRATLKVTTEPNVDWALTTPNGELVVSGWGSQTLKLPSNQSFVNPESKIRYAEYVFIAEVLSGNGDAFMSLTVDEDDEFSHTVACGRSGEPEVLYTMLNTGYGTKHWLVPGFLQGTPSRNPSTSVN